MLINKKTHKYIKNTIQVERYVLTACCSTENCRPLDF